MYTKEIYESYKSLLLLGMTSKEISIELNIPKRTIDVWRQGINIKRYTDENIIPLLNISDTNDFFYVMSLYNQNSKSENSNIYSFLLGLYLGDGYICELPRCIKITYALDVKYDKMNDYIINCLTKIFGKSPCVQDRRLFNNHQNCINVELYDKNIKEIFPHHGKGRKHLRKIELLKWQTDIIDPASFIKGLVYSDGCYFVRKGTGQKLYEIVNTSIDIINICSNYLNRLNIKHSIKERIPKTEHHAKIYKINIYGKHNVEKLHDLIGDKENVKL